MKSDIRKKILYFLKGWGISLVVALLIATSFKSAIAELNHVPTGSMKPTILEGDRIFVNKLAYDLKFPFTTFHLATWDNPERGEIVVFYSPADGTRLVKRVVGLPGDKIAMYHNKLFLNGVNVTYDSTSVNYSQDIPPVIPNQYVFYSEHLGNHSHPVMLTPGIPSLQSFAPLTVPKNHYFMMGDNRDNSADSRYFGFVDRRLILGRAPAIVYSLDREKHYKPRFDRFFKSLS